MSGIIAGTIYGVVRIVQMIRNTAGPMDWSDQPRYQAPILSNVAGSVDGIDEAVSRSHAFTARLRQLHRKRPNRVTHVESAKRLVDGLARMQPVTLFTPEGLSDDPTDPSRIIYDLLETLALSPRVVDVSADAEMHLGLPQVDGQAIVPHLYLKARPIGGGAAIFDLARSGELAKALTEARIRFDQSAAKSLRRRG